MADILKGNYQLTGKKKERQAKKSPSKSLTERFEESALARLGGSICFVMKGNTFVWTGDEDEEASS